MHFLFIPTTASSALCLPTCQNMRNFAWEAATWKPRVAMRRKLWITHLRIQRKWQDSPRFSWGRILQQELCKENGFFWVFFCLLVLCPFRRQFTVVIQTSTGEITIRYFFYFSLLMILKNQKVVIAWVWKCLKVQFSVQQSKQVSRHPSPTVITSTAQHMLLYLLQWKSHEILHSWPCIPHQSRVH